MLSPSPVAECFFLKSCLLQHFTFFCTLPRNGILHHFGIWMLQVDHFWCWTSGARNVVTCLIQRLTCRLEYLLIHSSEEICAFSVVAYNREYSPLQMFKSPLHRAWVLAADTGSGAHVINRISCVSALLPSICPKHVLSGPTILCFTKSRSLVASAGRFRTLDSAFWPSLVFQIVEMDHWDYKINGCFILRHRLLAPSTGYFYIPFLFFFRTSSIRRIETTDVLSCVIDCLPPVRVTFICRCYVFF